MASEASALNVSTILFPHSPTPSPGPFISNAYITLCSFSFEFLSIRPSHNPNTHHCLTLRQACYVSEQFLGSLNDPQVVRGPGRVLSGRPSAELLWTVSRQCCGPWVATGARAERGRALGIVRNSISYVTYLSKSFRHQTF